MDRPSPEQAHVWWIDRDTLGPSATETDVLAASVFADLSRRTRFLHGRAALRAILSAYLGRPAEDLALEVAEGGKPCLAPPGSLAFNLSHAGQWTGIAVARGDSVGIDAALNDDLDRHAASALALVASAHECVLLAALPPGERVLAERRLWTRKEAIGKALGVGLTGPPTTLEIGLSGKKSGAGALIVLDCPAPNGVTAAVCGSPSLNEIAIRHFSDLPLP